MSTGLQVLSRESSGQRFRWGLHGENLNAWCRLPGNPFTHPVMLLPNPPTLDDVSVTFGPVKLPEGFDTFTILLRGAARPPHAHVLRLEIAVRDTDGEVIAEAVHSLPCGTGATSTLRFGRVSDSLVSLAFRIGFEHFDGGETFGGVRIYYMLAYKTNPLVELCNTAGSDKGTEPYVGSGVPHCYAVEYHDLFAPFREDEFEMLEIGLETASKDNASPMDAPSLRVWSEFFPRATIYGFDIHDFGFFEQERTSTFQGDQSSREDLQRFIDEGGEPRFRLVIDDGSHASSHQQISLATLFPHVEPGGIYVIEDLHWQPFEEAPTTLEVLETLRDEGKVRSPFIEAAEARYLEETVASTEIRRPNDSDFGVIRKKA